MPTFWKRGPQTVRPRLPYQVWLLFCLLVFAATAVIVSCCGYRDWVALAAPATYTASGDLVQPGPPSAYGEPVANGPQKATAPIRRLALRQTGDSPQHAAEALQAAAEGHIRDGRAKWKSCMDERVSKARQAAENARKAYAEAASQLEAHHRQMASAANASRRSSSLEPPAPSLPRMIDNPQWLDLQQQLSRLERRYKQLLVDRMPLHPAVQDVAGRMSDLKARLAGMPQRIPADRARVSQTGGRSPSAPRLAQNPLPATAAKPQNTRVSRPPDTKIESELTAAVERARQVQSQAELEERLAVQAEQAMPTFTLQAVKVIRSPPPRNSAWRRLLATTLATSLLMALGFGSFTAGAGIEPPVTSPAELETEFGITVLGTVPATNAASPRRIRRRFRLRWLLIGLGLSIMGVCPMIAIWGIAAR